MELAIWYMTLIKDIYVLTGASPVKYKQSSIWFVNKQVSTDPVYSMNNFKISIYFMLSIHVTFKLEYDVSWLEVFENNKTRD